MIIACRLCVEMGFVVVDFLHGFGARMTGNSPEISRHRDLNLPPVTSEVVPVPQTLDSRSHQGREEFKDLAGPPRPVIDNDFSTPQNSGCQPTKSLTYKILSTKVMGGLALEGAANAVVGYAAVSYLLKADVPMILVLYGVSIFLSKIWRTAQEEMAVSKASLLSETARTPLAERVLDVSTELAIQLGVRPPSIGFTEKSNLGILEYRAVAGMPKGSILMFDPNSDLVRSLTDPELRGFIAHELCHLGDPKQILRPVRGIAESVVYPTAMVALVHSAFGILDQISVLGSTAGYVGAFCFGTLFLTTLDIGIQLLQRFQGRADEARTDIRAVELTGDITSFLSGLEKYPDEPKHSIWRRVFLDLIRRHPKKEARKRLLLSACK